MIIVVIIVLVGFVPAVVMPGFRSLAVYALTMTLIVAWMSLRDPGDGPGSWGGVLLAGYLAIGPATGVLGRIVGLLLRRTGFGWTASQAPVALAAAAVFGLLYYAHVWLPQQRLLPVPASCLTAKIIFKIGQATFVTAPVPNVEVSVRRQNRLLLRNSDDTRELCSETTSGETPFQAAGLGFYFGELSSRPSTEITAFCASKREVEWVRAFCAGAGTRPLADYPRRLAIGLDGDIILNPFGLRENLAGGIKFGVQKLVSTEMQSDATGKDSFDVQTYTGGAQRWVARDTTWQTPTGAPYTMDCSSGTCQVILACGEGVVLAYEFEAPASDLIGKARRVHANVLALLASLTPTANSNAR